MLPGAIYAEFILVVSFRKIYYCEEITVTENSNSEYWSFTTQKLLISYLVTESVCVCVIALDKRQIKAK